MQGSQLPRGLRGSHCWDVDNILGSFILGWLLFPFVHKLPWDTQWAGLNKEHQSVRLTRRQVRGNTRRALPQVTRSSGGWSHDDTQWRAESDRGIPQRWDNVMPRSPEKPSPLSPSCYWKRPALGCWHGIVSLRIKIAVWDSGKALLTDWGARPAVGEEFFGVRPSDQLETDGRPSVFRYM